MPAYKDKKTGLFYVQFYYRDARGAKRHKTKKGFQTELEALLWEKNFKALKDDAMDMTFADFCKVYEAEVRPRVREHTWLTKESIIKKKILPYFAKRKLSEITAKDIICSQNEVREMRDCHGKPLSKTYLKTVHNQLSAIFNHAARFYGLNLNPARQAGNMGGGGTEGNAVLDPGGVH